MLIHHNARPHKAYVVQKLIEDRYWIEFSHPPYSQDMNLFDLSCLGRQSHLSPNGYNNKQEVDSTINTAITSLNEN